MSDEPDPEEPSSFTRGAQTLHRGLDLLERAVATPMRIAELAERAGLTRGTAARLTNALVSRGYLTVAPGQVLRAGSKLLGLAAQAHERRDLLTVARPHLAAVSAETGLSSFLGRRDGDHSVHLYRNPGRERVMVATPTGTRRPLAETSIGKALLLDDPVESWQRLLAQADQRYHEGDWLAEMHANVARGVVIHHGPPPDSIQATAAPVRDASGRIVGAVNVATIAQYADAEKLETLATTIRRAADAISRALGWHARAERMPDIRTAPRLTTTAE